MDKKILTTRDVAEYLGIEEAEVRRLKHQGILRSLPGFKAPFKFSRQIIENFLNSEDPKKESKAEKRRREAEEFRFGLRRKR